MGIAISHVSLVEKSLQDRGFRARPWRRGCCSTKLWTHDDNYPVVTVLGIGNPAGMPLPALIDDYLNRLKALLDELLKRHGGVSDVVFQGGGSIEVPDWFRDWCQARNIAILVVHDSNVSEALATVGRRPVNRERGLRYQADPAMSRRKMG